MVAAKYDVLPKKDMSKVKKDIKYIKKTLTKRLGTQKKKASPAKFDNYYDLMPHKRIKRLEDQVVILKKKLNEKKPKKLKARKIAPRKKETQSIERSMNKLSSSLNNLIRLFEIAGKDTAAQSPKSSPQKNLGGDLAGILIEIRDKLAELSMENEEMAKGILVAVEMLKESIPEKSVKELGSTFENSFEKKDIFSAFGQEREKDLPPMPPLDSMPDSSFPQDIGIQRQQDKRRSMF